MCNVIWEHKERNEEDSGELFISTRLLLISSIMLKRQTYELKIYIYIYMTYFSLDMHKTSPFLFNIALVTNYI